MARYLDGNFPDRKIMGETPAEIGQDTMWDDRISVQILYRLTTMFHVLHQGLGPKLEWRYPYPFMNVARIGGG